MTVRRVGTRQRLKALLTTREDPRGGQIPVLEVEGVVYGEADVANLHLVHATPGERLALRWLRFVFAR